MYIPVLSNPVLEFQGILAIILLPCWNRWAGVFTLPFCPDGSEFANFNFYLPYKWIAPVSLRWGGGARVSNVWLSIGLFAKNMLLHSLSISVLHISLRKFQNPSTFCSEKQPLAWPRVWHLEKRVGEGCADMDKKFLYLLDRCIYLFKLNDQCFQFI